MQKSLTIKYELEMKKLVRESILKPKSHKEIASAIRSYSSPHDQLTFAIKYGDIQIVENALYKLKNNSFFDLILDEAVLYSKKYNKPKIYDHLIRKYKANPNPIQTTIQYGNLKRLKYYELTFRELISKNILELFKEAVAYDDHEHYEICKYLLKTFIRSVKMKSDELNYNEALIIAVEEGNYNVVNYILSHPRYDIATRYKKIALEKAKESGDENIVKLIKPFVY